MSKASHQALQCGEQHPNQACTAFVSRIILCSNYITAQTLTPEEWRLRKNVAQYPPVFCTPKLGHTLSIHFLGKPLCTQRQKVAERKKIYH